MLLGMELYAYNVKFDRNTHYLDMSDNGVYP